MSEVSFWSCLIIANVCFIANDIIWTLLGFFWVGLAMSFWNDERKRRK